MKSRLLERAEFAVGAMPAHRSTGRVIARALKEIENLLWVNLAGRHPLSDDRTVECLRALIAVPAVQQAIERGNDTATCFALRAINRGLRSGLRSRQTLTMIWELMAHPDIVMAISEERERSRRDKRPP